MDTKNYVLNALRRGDNVKHPRIKVSTIHSMKGGESDNVLVITDLSYASWKQYQKNPSVEHRVFYVAVTRAKKIITHIRTNYTKILRDMKKTDNVNHPPHYTNGDIECLDAIKSALGEDGFNAYLKGAIIKYLWRMDHKGNQMEDAQKAQFYNNRLVKELKGS